MLNQYVLVGRIVEIQENIVIVSSERPFKNAKGVYEKDFISFKTSDLIKQKIADYLKVGDVIGVKGRLASKKVKNGYSVEVVAEKVTFLSAKQES